MYKKSKRSRYYFDRNITSALEDGDQWGCNAKRSFRRPKYAKDLDAEMMHMIVYLQDKTDVCRSARNRSNRGLPYALDGSFFVTLEEQRKDALRKGKEFKIPEKDYLIDNHIPWHKFCETFIYDAFGEGKVVAAAASSTTTGDDEEKNDRIGSRPWYRQSLPVVPPRKKESFVYDNMRNCDQETFHKMMIELSKVRIERKLSDIHHFKEICKNRNDTWKKLDNLFTGVGAFLVDNESYKAYKTEREARFNRLQAITSKTEDTFSQFIDSWKGDNDSINRNYVKDTWNFYEMEVKALRDYLDVEKETILHISTGNNILLGLINPVHIFDLTLWWCHDAERDVAQWWHI